MMDYDKILNPTAVNIRPSGIRKFFGITETMDNIISLGVGEPDFKTPWHIRNAGIASLEEGKTRYTANSGMESLKEEICAYMKRRFELQYNTEEVLITVGGSEAIDVAIRSVVAEGDEVLIPGPCFVCYDPIVKLSGGVPVTIELKEDNNFVLTPEQIEEKVTKKTKAIVLAFPSNPTGAIMVKEELEKIAEVIKKHNLIVISDEIYAELTYSNKRHVSIAKIEGMKERTILVSGFSKAYSMTGWRLGFVLAPEPITSLMIKIHQFAIMSAPTTSQYAAIEALKNGDQDIEKMVEEYDTRRRFIVDGFNKLGLKCFEPKGAFYVFPCIRSTGLTSEDFCEKLIYSKRVVLIPGNAFGNCGEGFVRASYCYSIEHIKEALRRVAEFLDEYGNDK